MVRYKKSDEKRKQILFAAFEALARQGYDSVTLQTIADQARVSKGVVHYYFENKEAVLIELLQWLTAKIYEKECAAVQTKASAMDKLEAYLSSVFVSPGKNRSFYRVYLDFLARATRHPVYREINQGFYDNCRSISVEIVRLGQQEGVFSPDLSPEEAAPLMRALIDGSLIQWMMIDRDDLHASYKEECTRAILRLLGTS